jgi:hypothetical protein
MKNLTRLASACALLLGASFLTTGCAQNCHDETDPDTGKTVRVCEAETVTIFRASEPTVETLAYTAGYNITVKNDNGDVDVRKGSGTDLTVEFRPFSGRAERDEDIAVRDMTEDLELIATADGELVVHANKKDGSNSLLGCDMVVTLPAGFDGAVILDNDNGPLDADLTGGTPASTTLTMDGAGTSNITGAAGPLNIQGASAGDTTVTLSSDPLAWGGGTITAGGPGDVTVSVPSGANGSIQIQACGDNAINAPSLPSDWVASPDNSDVSQSYTMGSGGDNLSITCDGQLGETTLRVQ